MPVPNEEAAPADVVTERKMDAAMKRKRDIEVAFGPHHDCRIIPNVVPYFGNSPQGVSRYKFKVVCSCQWECLCITEDEAKVWQGSHLRSHGSG
jgi:hypothetical protein